MRSKEVDKYISGFPKSTQKHLNEIRAEIMKAAPDAEECISYKMPAYRLNGVLVYFAGYEKHIGFYAVPNTHNAFRKELSPYKSGKGSVQFPLYLPLPLDLISRMVKFRVAENGKKAMVADKRKETGGSFVPGLSAPANRALEGKGIKTLKQLSRFTESEILSLHGVGPSSVPKMKKALEAGGLSFKTGGS